MLVEFFRQAGSPSEVSRSRPLFPPQARYIRIADLFEMDSSGTGQNQIYALIQTACEKANLPLLPTYLPGFLATFSAYQLLYVVIGPWLSTSFFPKVYPHLRGKKKLEWDENVVSLIQAVVLTTVAAQVVWFDEERHRMTWQERVWGYTEPAAVVLTIANGYFYWHTMMMLRYRSVFGWAMVAHGVAVSFLMTNGYVSLYETEFVSGISILTEKHSDRRF
jgi:hypothetical protein